MNSPVHARREAAYQHLGGTARLMFIAKWYAFAGRHGAKAYFVRRVYREQRKRRKILRMTIRAEKTP